jgi:glucose/arabinose dehydrogenase
LLLCVAVAVAQPFRVDTVAKAPYVQYPVAIAFVPGGNGAFFLTEKNSGSIRFYDRRLLEEPFATVTVESEGEQGLLGIAVHPSFTDSPYVYVFYTRSPDRSGLLERFRDSSGIGVSPTTLLTVPPAEKPVHIGGSLTFGPDGKLYLTVGDCGEDLLEGSVDRSGDDVRGAILRLNEDGSIPSDNPVPSSPVWASGYSNPLGLAFDPGTGMMLCTENGRNGWNEVSVVARGSAPEWSDMRGGGRHAMHRVAESDLPGLSGICVYRGEAFPRLNGIVLFGGHGNQILWAGTRSERGDSLHTEPLYKTNAGYSDVKVAPDGTLLLVNGPYISSRILRLSPVAPSFISEPPAHGTQGVGLRYTPAFQGTPPALSLLAGPEGMTVDTVAWSLVWTPTNEQALAGVQSVTLRARNGAGWADQTFSLPIANVNDPPIAFRLLSPLGEDIQGSGTGNDVTFRWNRTEDPDRDTLRYIIELDTTEVFLAPLRRDTVGGTVDSCRILIPGRAGEWFWRVTATDGQLTTLAEPKHGIFFTVGHASLLPENEPAGQRHVVLEQNFPNPFNPATSIKYTLPHSGHVRLSVFNLLGQEVALIFDGVLSEGTHETEFTKAELPTGIYFYRIQGPDFFETKKMVISK